MTQPVSKPARPALRPLLVFFAALAVVIGVAIAAGFLPRLARQRVLLAASEKTAEARPVAIVSPAHLAAASNGIDLPGDMQALVESPIFARANGYLKSRRVDIGDRVQTGQLMAEIETPELDQQIRQA